MKRSLLFKLREFIEEGAENLSDAEALEVPQLFPEWKVGVAYEQGARLWYKGKLYKVVQAHTSQANWLPDRETALYTEIAKPGEIPVWKQPTGSQDAYNKGDKVHYPTAADPVYVSTMDANVYAPDVYGWEKE